MKIGIKNKAVVCILKVDYDKRAELLRQQSIEIIAAIKGFYKNKPRTISIKKD